VEMSTSKPSLAQTIAETASKRGKASLDAPVSGGDIGARHATLAIMVGGDELKLLSLGYHGPYS
jgi:3-hydroxyisobutyrate dehydrogenase